MALKTYEDLNDFLSTEIEKLNYEQAKKLIEFYIEDFVTKVSSDFYQDFLNHDEKFHLTTIDILIVYFGSLTKLLNIKVRDKEWAINPYIQPYIEKLQYQINKGIA